MDVSLISNYSVIKSSQSFQILFCVVCIWSCASWLMLFEPMQMKTTNSVVYEVQEEKLNSYFILYLPSILRDCLCCGNTLIFYFFPVTTQYSALIVNNEQDSSFFSICYYGFYFFFFLPVFSVFFSATTPFTFQQHHIKHFTLHKLCFSQLFSYIRETRINRVFYPNVT